MGRNVLIEFRRDTAANWTSTNPTLASGEPGFETDTGKVKIGDGSTAWTSLPYVGTGTASPLTTKGDVWGYSSTNARIPVGTNGQVLTADSTQTLGLKWATSSGFANPMTTEGDLIIENATPAPDRLAIGSTGQVLTVAAGLPAWETPAAGIPSGGAAGQVVGYGGSSGTGAWVYPPGHEYDYVQITSRVTVTATTDGNSQGTAVIDGNAVTYDGSTRVKIEFYAPYLEYSVLSQNILCNLYDGTNDLGRLVTASDQVSGTGEQIASGTWSCFLTPTAGAHTYHIRGWKTNSGGTAAVGAGGGGASNYSPAWYRITKA